MKIIVLFAFIALALSQSSVGSTCQNPCYAPNTNPCPSSTGTTGGNNQVCKQNSDATSTCPFVCVESTADQIKINEAFSTCTKPCEQSTYRCTSDQVCETVNNTCKTCVAKCSPSQCLVQPCSNKVAADCAKRVAAASPYASPVGPVCKDNYCGGCIAEWYFNGERICTRPAETCPACTGDCANGQVRKVDHQTGCPICDSCTPACTTPACSTTVYCPNGYALDNNGCKTCQCNPCSDLAGCTLSCPNGYAIDPATNCKKCACAPSPCEALTSTNCNLNCANGYVIDSNGCKKCECKQCPALSCPATSVDCPNGRILKDGCPTCDCIPHCLNICPLGYEYFAPGSTSTTAECKCKCPTINCFAPCPYGYKFNEYGCQTCDCIGYNGCPKVACALYCEYGYQYKDGCPTCTCNEKPFCPAVLCAHPCPYGTIKDSATGCPGCECQACPEVLCARYCEFGYRKNIVNGCPYCECNEKPVCPAGSVTSAICPLDCVNGLTTSDGCTDCKCNPVEPCKCDPVPTTEPKLCLDKVTYSKYTGECRRTPDNKCYLVRIECPIGIEVTVKGTLTDAQFAEIKAKNGITNDADVTVTKTTNTDGTNTYTIFVKKEGLPEGKTASDVNNDVSTEAKKTDPNAVSFVLQESNTPGNFGALLVPLFGLLAFIFF